MLYCRRFAIGSLKEFCRGLARRAQRSTPYLRLGISPLSQYWTTFWQPMKLQGRLKKLTFDEVGREGELEVADSDIEGFAAFRR